MGEEPPTCGAPGRAVLPPSTNSQQAALILCGFGLNVFPKVGFPWKALQYIHLPHDGLWWAFHARCNLAVMRGRTSANLFVIDWRDSQALPEPNHAVQGTGHPSVHRQYGASSASGTTAKVALALGRHYLGCDISSGYVELALKRLETATLPIPELFKE